MNKTLATILLLTSFVLAGDGVSALCPQDGQTAYIIGRNTNGCQYAHNYHGERHVFWDTCED